MSTEAAYTVVRVHWIDAGQYPGWHSKDELDTLIATPLPVMETVGWLVHDCTAFVVVAQSVSEMRAGDLLRIPRAYIQDMWVQKEQPPDASA